MVLVQRVVVVLVVAMMLVSKVEDEIWEEKVPELLDEARDEMAVVADDEVVVLHVSSGVVVDEEDGVMVAVGGDPVTVSVPALVLVAESVDAVDVTLALENELVVGLTTTLVEEEVESWVTVCVLITTVTAVVDVVCGSTGTTDTSVWVTVVVASLAGAVTVTSSVVVFVSVDGDAVTVWTTVVVASFVDDGVVVAAATDVVEDPPSMGTTE